MEISRTLGGGGSSPPLFVGILDGLSEWEEGAWSVSARLQTSYAGPLMTIRRASDDDEADIGYDAHGLADQEAITSFTGGGDWYVVRVYDQSGNGLDLRQPTVVEQPKGMVDGNGLVCCTSDAESFVVTYLAHYTPSPTIYFPAYTSWGVGAAAGLFDLMTIYTTEAQPRRLLNYSNEMAIYVRGPIVNLTSTNSQLYTMVGQVGEAGCRLHNGLTFAATEGGVQEADVNYLGVGASGSEPLWQPGSRWYAGAVWSADIGDAAVDAFQARARALFQTQ